MITRFILFIILFCCVISCNATELNIYYPNNNTTTDIYYSIGHDFIYLQNNTLNATNLNTVILKNQIVCDDIINDPIKIFNILPLLFWTLIIAMIIIFIIYKLKKALT